ncbi:uncharacterized protein ARB_06536 [Trichophyton benhamiae CBS 112371]|uniref:Uncharacterized protein n=1 Tax=Arthroderma benhamiae (strain ATCC MYA-4681 / CBS 112371) TaxID=663331 RepID=D4AQM7_ARTBC|nr:uncharacterized protein ARB_06536 [Trichophyton benhamiae CBS 112371]EFE34771.1 hypothetical protein ARB_06536 [Trichophyton benhamiae CBS 112371]
MLLVYSLSLHQHNSRYHIKQYIRFYLFKTLSYPSGHSFLTPHSLRAHGHLYHSSFKMSTDSGYCSLQSSPYYKELQNGYFTAVPDVSSASSFSASNSPVSLQSFQTGTPPGSISDILETRKEAKEILLIYRTTLAELELRRMSGSRKGLQRWVEYWTNTYKPDFARPLCQKIELACPEINRIFREAAQDVYQIINEIDACITSASHQDEVRDLMASMRCRIHRIVSERRVRANQLMEWLRCDIESTPVDIQDKMFDRLKKQVYGLDPSGHYHPNPEEEEREERQEREDQVEENQEETIEERLRQQMGLLNMATLPDSLRQVIAVDNARSQWAHYATQGETFAMNNAEGVA